MSEYRSDEETVEAIARWWKENGPFLVVTVIVTVGGILGWNAWQARVSGQADAAASLYLAWERATGDEADAIAAELRDAFPRSTYRALIGFDGARRAMEAGDHAAARAALEDVLSGSAPVQMQDLARIRLARIALDVDDAEEALAELARVRGGDTLSLVEELRGDAMRLLGREADALAAYERALAVAEQPRPLLEIKHEDLRGRLGGAPQ